MSELFFKPGKIYEAKVSHSSDVTWFFLVIKNFGKDDSSITNREMIQILYFYGNRFGEVTGFETNPKRIGDYIEVARETEAKR